MKHLFCKPFNMPVIRFNYQTSFALKNEKIAF